MSLPADLSSPVLAPEGFAGTDAPWIDPVSRLLWWLMAGAALALAVAIWQLGFRIRQLEYGAAYLLALAAFGLLFRRRGRIGAGAFLECLAQFLLMGILLGLLALVIAGTGLPYRDEELALLDRLLVPDWLAASRWLVELPLAGKAMNYAYASIGVQPFVLLATLVFTGRIRRLRVFLLAWAATLACVIAIFPFVPAVGAYLHYGIAQAEIPQVLVNVGWRHVELLEPIRAGVLRDVHFYSFAGIVTFPSFHAAAAVLLAWGFWGVSYLRWPALAINLLMIVSSMPIGAHYVVDLAAGIALAWAALRVSQNYAARCGASADPDRETGPWLRAALPFLFRTRPERAPVPVG